jgi:hypothetical protein
VTAFERVAGNAIDTPSQAQERAAVHDGDSVYRCADCGHGRHLWAWAGANAYGPLATNGELEYYEDVDEWGIHEDSIQCSEHPGAVIEHSIDGQWHRWWSCARCHGRSLLGDNGRPWLGDGRSYPCGGDGTFKVGDPWGGPRHEGDLPVAEWKARMAKRTEMLAS